MDILGYLKNTHKNPKFGKVRQVPTREFPTKFPDWDLSQSSKLGCLWVFFKYPKISTNESLFIFSCDINIGKKRKKKGKSAKRKEKRRRLAEARKVCKQLLVFYIIIHLLFLQDFLKKIADVTKGNIKLLL